MGEVNWRRVNDEKFEYAINNGPNGDEFVKLPDGSFLRRHLTMWLRLKIRFRDWLLRRSGFID